MLNLKKVIALVCVFALALSTVAFGATYTDVTEDSAYYEAVETLNKLEIVTGYEDGTFKPEDGVTRAEMAALIARIQGYGETAKASANTGFADVPASHWASGYIANAAGMGIINGYGDGTFGPEDPVKYEQAVKMIMSTLGYTPFADKNGGYPTGYLAAAQRYDVSLSVANAAVGTDANRGTVAQLLANAIDTPLMVQSKWNTNGEVEYVIADGKGGNDYKTLMSENLGYVKLKGIVVENAITALGSSKTGLDTTAVATVKIDVEDSYDTNNKAYLTYVPDGAAAGKEFLVGDTDAADYVGYKVIAYVKNVNDKFELVSIAKDANSNDTLTIALDQYAGISGNEISYYKEGANDATKFDVESGFKAIYNGVGMAGTAALDIVGTNCLFGGEMTFIDNNDTKGYDAVIVELASTGVVKKVTEDGINFYNNVTWKTNGGTASTKAIDIDVEDETVFVEITKDGEVIDFTTLEAWDVLSIYAVSETADVIKAEVIGTEVVGVIASSKNSTTSAFPVSAGKAYKIADTWYDVAAGAYGLANVAVGDGGTFYIDQFGKIAAFDEDAALATGTAGSYGYVIATSSDEATFGGGVACEAKVQMLTADGVKVFDLKDKFKVEDGAGNALVTVDITAWEANEKDPGTDGELGTSDDVANPEYHATMIGDLNTAVVGQVVKYTVNSAGEISGIVKAVANDTKFATGTVTSTTAGYEWDADNNRFKKTSTATVYVDSDAIVFIVDSSADKCKMGTIADFDHEGTYTIDATYADRKAVDNNIIVAQAGSFLTSTTSSVAVITEVGEGANEDGETIKSLGFLLDGETVYADTVALSDVSFTGTSAANLTIGDVVNVKVGSDGLITAIAKVVEFADGVRDYSSLVNSATTGSVASGSGKEAFAGGVVVDFNENNYLATIGSTQYKLTQAANIYVIDGTGKNLIVKNGSEGNFKYFEALYGSADVDIYLAGNNTTTPDADEVVVGTAQAYADHVYVRTYEGKVTDVIIVKGLDLKVKVDA